MYEPENVEHNYLDLTVTLLSPYKKPILRVVFHDAYLLNIGSLTLSYQGDATIVQHTFGIQFTYMEVLPPHLDTLTPDLFIEK
jgi:hypothetical protein